MSIGPVLDPRRLPCDHFNDAAAEGPDVGWLTRTEPLDNLRSHPIGTAFDLLEPSVVITTLRAFITS